MSHGAPTAQALSGGPRTAPPASQGERSEQKRNLASWWNNFKRSDRKPQEQQGLPPQGIFGVPLQESIRYANVAISLFNDDGQSYIYGYVPIVVAKCGVFLKEKATDVEGIFRLAGSEKRIKELKIQFDSPDRYGKGLDWTGFTVHDAANILRRYFNQLPEPIIPLGFYERFREPLRNHQAQAVGELEAQSPSVGHFDEDAAIRQYQNLITELPPLNRQLLLYILDLLAVFASKSELNKMTTPNLSAIFQPGILNHPQHEMSPPEYRLSQDVLIFLIENQDNFLIGMQGTAADPETVRDVQSGVPTPSKPPSTPTTPGRSKTIIGRSASNASAGADSVRKHGSIRRNLSVSSSKKSKKSESGPTVVAGAMSSPATPSSGVYRSNTVPSRRAGSNAASPRFSRDSSGNNSTGISEKARQESLQNTPTTSTTPQFGEPKVRSPASSEATTPLAPVTSNSSSLAREYQTPKKDTTPLLAPPGGSAESRTERSPSQTQSTTGARGLLDIFKQSPPSEGDGRKPNKLKKRIPGSSLSSAQSSSQSLTHEETIRSPTSPSAAPESGNDLTGEKTGEQSEYGTPLSAPHRGSAGGTLKPAGSPTQSYHSNTDLSDVDMMGDELPKEQAFEPEKKKKGHRWQRFSRSQNKLEQSSPQPSQNPLGTMSAKEQTTSRSTFGSTGGQPRRSFQEPTPLASAATDPVTPMGSPPMNPTYGDPVFSDSEREKKGGPMSWIRGKIQERKDKDAERLRTRTPERHRGERDSRQDLALSNEPMPVRGKSVEQQRVSSAGLSSTPNPNAMQAAQVAATTTTSPSTTESSPEAPAPAPASLPAANGERDHGGNATAETLNNTTIESVDDSIVQRSDEAKVQKLDSTVGAS